MFKQKDPAVSLFDQWTERWRTPSAPFDWKWRSRYTLAFVVLAGCFAWVANGNDNNWLWLGPPAIFSIWALIVARELGILVLVITALLIVWHFTKDFSKITWTWIAAIVLFGWIGRMQDKDNKRLQAQIDKLNSRINRLENSGGW